MINMLGDFKSLLEQQYILSKKCGISISESSQMADFEREIYVSLLMKVIKEEMEALDK